MNNNNHSVIPITAENFKNSGKFIYEAQQELSIKLGRLSEKASYLAKILSATADRLDDIELVEANLIIYNYYNSEVFSEDITASDLRLLELLSIQASWPMWKRKKGSYNYEPNGDTKDTATVGSIKGYSIHRENYGSKD